MEDCKIDCMCYDCVISHNVNGCNYGQADGPEDVVKECDCLTEEE